MASILVVDDDALVRSYLTRVLTHEGHTVITVESGEDALACVAEQEFDLAFVDLKMDGIGGMEVISVLRERWPDTIVIVLTGHPTLETVFEALRRGAFDYMFKPCRIADLRESLSKGLRQRQRKVDHRGISLTDEAESLTSRDSA